MWHSHAAKWMFFSFLASLLKTSEERNNCFKHLNCFILGVGRKKILFSKTEELSQSAAVGSAKQ